MDLFFFSCGGCSPSHFPSFECPRTAGPFLLPPLSPIPPPYPPCSPPPLHIPLRLFASPEARSYFACGSCFLSAPCCAVGPKCFQWLPLVLVSSKLFAFSRFEFFLPISLVKGVNQRRECGCAFFPCPKIFALSLSPILPPSTRHFHPSRQRVSPLEARFLSPPPR